MKISSFSKVRFYLFFHFFRDISFGGGGKLARISQTTLYRRMKPLFTVTYVYLNGATVSCWNSMRTVGYFRSRASRFGLLAPHPTPPHPCTALQVLGVFVTPRMLCPAVSYVYRSSSCSSGMFVMFQSSFPRFCILDAVCKIARLRWSTPLSPSNGERTVCWLLLLSFVINTVVGWQSISLFRCVPIVASTQLSVVYRLFCSNL